MSKRKTNTQAAPPEISLPAAPAVQHPTAPEVSRPAPVEWTKQIAVPLTDTPAPGYCSRRFHVEVHLGRQEAEAFRRMQAALDARHARLRNGRVVQSRADACRWLFEQLAGE